MKSEHAHLWPYAKRMTAHIFKSADTLTIRLLLGTASLLYAAILLGNKLVGIEIFERHGYEVMRVYMNEWCWSALFILHFVGVVWRAYDPRARHRWALGVNGLGFGVWAVSTASIGFALGGITPGTSIEWVLVCASGWAMYRTGWGDDGKLVSE